MENDSTISCENCQKRLDETCDFWYIFIECCPEDGSYKYFEHRKDKD